MSWTLRALSGSRSPSAFTLLEVLIALALIALLGGLVAGGAATLVRERPATAEELVCAMVQRSRRKAVETLQEVRLSYVAQERLFVLATPGGVLEAFPAEIKGELQIEFLEAERGSLRLLGGESLEGSTVAFVTFFPDGGATPFRVQVRTGGPARLLRFDPWTCAQIKESP